MMVSLHGEDKTKRSNLIHLLFTVSLLFSASDLKVNGFGNKTIPQTPAIAGQLHND